MEHLVGFTIEMLYIESEDVRGKHEVLIQAAGVNLLLTAVGNVTQLTVIQSWINRQDPWDIIRKYVNSKTRERIATGKCKNIKKFISVFNQIDAQN